MAHIIPISPGELPRIIEEYISMGCSHALVFYEIKDPDVETTTVWRIVGFNVKPTISHMQLALDDVKDDAVTFNLGDGNVDNLYMETLDLALFVLENY